MEEKEKQAKIAELLDLRKKIQENEVGLDPGLVKVKMQEVEDILKNLGWNYID